MEFFRTSFLQNTSKRLLLQVRFCSTSLYCTKVKTHCKSLQHYNLQGKKTSLTLRNICKWIQKPKIYVGRFLCRNFCHDVELLCKKWSQAILEIFHVKESRHLIVKENLGPKAKNQTIKLLEIADSICCFYGCLPICKKIMIIVGFSLNILEI